MTTNGSEERRLPEGWTWTTIGEAAKTTSGGTPSRKRPEYYGGTIPWVKSGELGDSIVTSVSETITEEGLKNSSAKIFPKGTALVALYGATVGKTGILGIDAATNQAVCAIFPEDGLFTAKYMTYWLRSQRDTLIGLSSGGAQPNISQTIVKAFHFPLAPFSEQERIVAEIEKQFTRLDQAVASLRRLQSNLARYKASVLKAACEGRLVPQDPADEPAEQLLARILAERRAQWQAANPGKKYKEPVGVEGEAAVLPDLPESWVWASLEQIAAHEPNSITDGPFGSKLKTSHYTASGPRVIRLQNIGDGEFVNEKAHISKEHYDFLKKHKIFAGDLVIAGLGVSLPRACIIPDYVGPAIVKADCIRFKPHPKIALAKYINAALNSDPLKKFAANIVHGIGRPRLNQQEIKSLAIPLPPLAEQERIVAEVERRLSVVTAIEQTITANLSRAERLRQSILHRAFTGQLVPQTKS